MFSGVGRAGRTANHARWPVLLLAACLTGVLAGCLSVSSSEIQGASLTDASEGSLAAGALLPNLTWYAGPHTGSFALRLFLTFMEDAECEFTYSARGHTEHLGPTVAFQAWATMSDDGATRGPFLTRGDGSLTDQHARVQAVGVVDERIRDDWPWAAARTYGIEHMAGDTVELLFAADVVSLPPERIPSGGEPLTDDSSAALEVGCTGPVRVDALQAGEAARFFDETTLDTEPGIGAHLQVVSAPSGAQVVGRAQLDIEREFGYLAARTGGDILMNHLGAGLIEVEYPGGTDAWIDRPAQLLIEFAFSTVTNEVPDFLLDHVYQAGSGTYTLDATYASGDRAGTLQGVMLGMDSVESLDDLGFGWTVYSTP